MTTSDEKQKALRGELYRAFVPELIAERRRCSNACRRLNDAGEVSRRRLVELWRDINGDETPLPPQLDDAEQDAAQFDEEPWIEPPLRVDYGTNVRLGTNVFINSNCAIIDTCLVTIGSRTLIGPNVSFYSGTHPLDPGLRNGTKGPELGKEIHVEPDCWIGGNVILLPGVRIGRGSTLGAGSVVTKSLDDVRPQDVPPYHVVAGNPARIIRKIETNTDPAQYRKASGNSTLEVAGAEEPMREMAERFEQEKDGTSI